MVNYFTANFFSVKTLITYLILVNLFGFFMMYYDKRKAKKGGWRTPEKSLFTITLLGGGLGTTIGMYVFRHKTKKLRFTIGFPTILITEIVLAIYFYLKYTGKI